MSVVLTNRSFRFLIQSTSMSPTLKYSRKLSRF